MLTQRIHHFGIAVSDLETSRNWYEEKLEFRVEKRFILEDARVSIVKLVNEHGIRVELLTSLDPENKPLKTDAVVNPGAKHLCFDVDDIQAAADEARRRGIRIVQEPKTIEESREKNCWIADNEGNMIEFIENMD